MFAELCVRLQRSRSQVETITELVHGSGCCLDGIFVVWHVSIRAEEGHAGVYTRKSTRVTLQMTYKDS